jgi:hypothetical protein
VNGRAVLVATIAITLLASGAARAQILWNKARVSQAGDVSAEPLQVEAGDVGGYLLVRLPPAVAQNDFWTLRVNVRGATTTTLSSQIVDAERLARNSDGSIDVSVPLARDGALTIETDPPGPVRALLVFSPSGVRQQQRVAGSVPEFFDGGAHTPTDVWSVGKAVALLEAFGANGQPLFACTAFRIAPHFWLTAGHCITRSDEGVPATFRLTLNAYARGAVPGTPFSARPVLSGQQDGAPNSSVRWPIDAPDFAILEASNDPDGVALPLSRASVTASKPLQVLMQFAERQPPMFKARSAGPSCKVIVAVGTSTPGSPDLCFLTFSHGCSTNEGSSGGAIVDAGQPDALIGLHYRSGPQTSDASARYNCGLPSASIQTIACRSNPNLARRFTTCP